MPNEVVVTSGQVLQFFVTDLLRFLNAELRQKYILHQVYVLSYTFSYVMNTQIYASIRSLYPLFFSDFDFFEIRKHFLSSEIETF